MFLALLLTMLLAMLLAMFLAMFAKFLVNTLLLTHKANYGGTLSENIAYFDFTTTSVAWWKKCKTNLRYKISWEDLYQMVSLISRVSAFW